MDKVQRRGCRHFSGLLEDKCRAGVAYKSLRHPFPCLVDEFTGKYTETCPLFAFYTEQEIDEEERKLAEAVNVFFGKLNSDVCPHCDTPITSKRQVGRCVYADPCGCRLYQGTVSGMPLEDADVSP